MEEAILNGPLKRKAMGIMHPKKESGTLNRNPEWKF
jgi:hypothetical protein